MTFCSILHTLKSPKNVGMIVRSHIANGGDQIIITGHALPWCFKKGSLAFSRKLEKQADIIYIPNPDDVFGWCNKNDYKVVAMEIQSSPVFLPGFNFPSKSAIAVGNEATGLPADFLAKCHAVVTVPQYGLVSSLNVAVSLSIAMYEYNRYNEGIIKITENKYLKNSLDDQV